MKHKGYFRPVSLPRAQETENADQICKTIFAHLLTQQQVLRKKDELYDIDLAREEKAMKDNIEKRQQKQKVLLEQYEITMKNDLVWNDFIENINKLSSHHFPDYYDLKEFIHFYFSKSALTSFLSPKQNQQVQQDPTVIQQQSKIQLLCEFLTDLLTKEHTFPYQAILHMQSLLDQLVTSLDPNHLIHQHKNLRKLMISTDSLLFEIKDFEKKCIEASNECDKVLTSTTSNISSVQEMRRRIEQMLSVQKFQSYLPADLFSTLNNCVLNLQEKEVLATTQNKELSNQQFLLRKYFPNILAQRQAIQSYQQSRANQKLSLKQSPSLEMINQLKHILINAIPILEAKLSLSLIADSSNKSPAITSMYPIEWILDEILFKMMPIFLQLIKSNSQLLPNIINELLETIISILANQNPHLSIKVTKEVIQIYALLTYSLFHELKSPSLQRQFQKLFISYLQTFDICVPNFILPVSREEKMSSKDNEPILLFLSFVLLYSNDNNNDHYDNDNITGNTPTTSTSSSSKEMISGPLSAAFGFDYLMRCFQQLYYLLYYQTGSSLPQHLKNSASVSEICFSIFLFLKYSGYVFAIKYQKRYDDIIRQLHNLITSSISSNPQLEGHPDVTLLLQLLTDYLEKKVVNPSFYNYQSTYGVHSLIAVRKMKDFLQEIMIVEKNKQSYFMILVKKYEIDRIRMIFNRLGSSSESHQKAFSDLLEKIVFVSQISTNNNTSQRPADTTGILNNNILLNQLQPTDQEKQFLLRYLLMKIVINIFKDCQEEFFNEMDELQVLRLARITCLLCQEIKEFIPIFHDYFYMICPMLMPKLLHEIFASTNVSPGVVVSVELQQEHMLLSRGFTRKLKKDSQTDYNYEGDDAWAARMNKIVAVFALICVQSEQIPRFTIHDIWKFLVRLTNDCSQLGASISSREFVLAAYETTLKITAPALYQSYQNYFVQLLQLIQEKIMIHYSADKHPKKVLLQTFIQTFIQSQGRESISLFVATKK